MNQYRVYWRDLRLLACIVGCIFLAGCGAAQPSRNPTLLLTPAAIPVDAVENRAPGAMPDVLKGGQIYAAKCQACHGDTGQGDGPRSVQVKAQGGQVAKLVNSVLASSALPASWFDVVTNGRIDKLMPGFSQSLTSQDRWDVLSYVWAMGLDKTTLLSMQQAYNDGCQSCHGPTGKGDGSQAGSKSMTSFNDAKWLTRNSLLDISTAMVKGSSHARVKLSESDRLAMASYLRTFGYRYSDPLLSAKTVNTGNGVLHLNTTNGTTKGKVVTGLPVTLHTYDTSGEVFSRTGVLDGQGVATFSQLPIDPNLFYQADLTYSGAKFYAPPAQFSGTVELSETLPFYEVTNDPSVITISEFHFFVQNVGEGSINVVEYYIYDNMSDHAFIDKPGADGQLRSLKVSLPSDATNLKFDGPGLGVRFFQDGTTIYDSDAAPPGPRATTIAMIYDLPYRNGKAISRQMDYGVKSWDAFLPDNEMRINGMIDKGLQPIQTSSIRMYVPDKADVEPGGDVAFTLTGQPHGAPRPGEDNTAITTGLITLAVAIAGATFMIIRSRRWQNVDVDIRQERENLLQDISELDHRFAARVLDESEYQRARRELKEQLREIWE